MQRVALLVLLLSQSAVTIRLQDQDSDGSHAFKAFIEQHERSYQEGTSEYQARHTLFLQRLAEVKQQNEQPDGKWKAEINKFSDWTSSEMKEMNGWAGGIAKNAKRASSDVISAFLGPDKSNQADLPESVSWLNLKSVQKVVSQNCGNCWAFAAHGVLEAHSELYQKSARLFPASHLTKCTKNPDNCGGTGGCGGATPELAIQHVMQNGADPLGETCGTYVTSEDAKGYASKAGEVGLHAVRTQFTGPSFGLYGYERLPENRLEPLMRAVATLGPVAISVAGDFGSYQKGVYDGCRPNAIIDHSVLLVGYGKERLEKNGQMANYWHVQNSWGASWGDHGRIKLLRHDKETDHCGIDNQPQLGTTCDKGPKQVKVCGMCGILYDTVVPHFKPVKTAQFPADS